MNHIRNPLAEALLSLPQGEEIIRRVHARIAERKAMNPTLRVKRLTATATLPAYARPGDAGMDLVADESAFLKPGQTVRVSTGLSFEIPKGYEGQVRPRSGLSCLGLTAILGTIDSGYRGNVAVIVHFTGAGWWSIAPGDRIAQLVIAPVARCAVVEAEELSATERGERGFGSTGIAAQPPASSTNEAEGGQGEGKEGIGAQGGVQVVAIDPRDSVPAWLSRDHAMPKRMAEQAARMFEALRVGHSGAGKHLDHATHSHPVMGCPCVHCEGKRPAGWDGDGREVG